MPEIVHPMLSHKKEVAGVFVGHCKENGKRFWAKAHAHTRGPNKGWICYLSSKWLHVMEVALHEYAHLVCDEPFHNDKWRKACLGVGGTIKQVPGILQSYEKRSRK